MYNVYKTVLIGPKAALLHFLTLKGEEGGGVEKIKLV